MVVGRGNWINALRGAGGDPGAARTEAERLGKVLIIIVQHKSNTVAVQYSSNGQCYLQYSILRATYFILSTVRLNCAYSAVHLAVYLQYTDSSTTWQHFQNGVMPSPRIVCVWCVPLALCWQARRAVKVSKITILAPSHRLDSPPLASLRLYIAVAVQRS